MILKIKLVIYVVSSDFSFVPLSIHIHVDFNIAFNSCLSGIIKNLQLCTKRTNPGVIE